jgi:hypothetical protein
MSDRECLMKLIKSNRIALALLVGAISIPLIGGPPPGAEATVIIHDTELPAPDLRGTIPFESAMAHLTECQGFDPEFRLTGTELGQLLWATAAGVAPTLHSRVSGVSPRHSPDTGTPSGLPRDRGMDPPCDLQIYAVTHNNVHLYDPASHSCRSSLRGGLIDSLASLVSFETASMVKDAAMMVILVGDPGGCQGHMGKRGDEFLLLRAGESTRNLRLQAQTLGLGSLACELFRREAVAELLRIPQGRQPLSLVAIGGIDQGSR